ncbi:MAG TPA: polysaccharide deacetylase family protein [Vicinamibacterales bacterium]|nr:polysaccharide deacetylase family protein [Vicinamibacterales bacterium]
MSGMKTIVKNALMKSFLASGVPAARNRVATYMGHGRLTVLTYHQVKEPANDGSSVTPKAFDEQMHYLRQHYEVVRLEDGVKRLARRRAAERLIAITFDDGYLDNATAAAPIMHSVGLTATFFVSTDMIGSTQPFPHDVERRRAPQPHMTWNDLRHLVTLGFDIGSHTCSHADMGTIPSEQAHRELRLSKERLEAELHQPVRLFAFPYGGRRNMRPETIDAARREYDVCCSAYGGHNTTPVDPADIRRIVISSGVSFLAFRAVLEGWPMIRLANPRPAAPSMITAVPAR